MACFTRTEAIRFFEISRNRIVTHGAWPQETLFLLSWAETIFLSSIKKFVLIAEHR
jgi:hypothetical protein